MVNGTSDEVMISHTAHIIKDVFDINNNVIVLGNNEDLVRKLRSQEHGIEAWGLDWNGDGSNEQELIKTWAIRHGDSHFGHRFCRLILSIDTADPEDKQTSAEIVVTKIARLMKDHGIIMLVNPGDWSDHFSSFFTRRVDLEKKLKAFTLFSTENVEVYEYDY